MYIVLSLVLATVVILYSTLLVSSSISRREEEEELKVYLEKELENEIKFKE
ncbi:hypothetical protein PFZ59_00660 [Streptococcus suis]|uniref:hypothetical protein n=1 Tax=Streptococcus suis TaxID=1307 RepID=UPI001ABE9680|nr:hypothetical protein [Streptococcus suis]MBO4127855.1 hypothetical protein [Streptococcus suis]WFA76041.1 hypothetical protein PFZ59_00660 [Streptococcus suis]